MCDIFQALINSLVCWSPHEFCYIKSRNIWAFAYPPSFQCAAKTWSSGTDNLRHGQHMDERVNETCKRPKVLSKRVSQTCKRPKVLNEWVNETCNRPKVLNEQVNETGERPKVLNKQVNETGERPKVLNHPHDLWTPALTLPTWLVNTCCKF